MIDEYSVRHVEFVSTRPFEEVVQAFEEATGDVEDGAFTRELSRSRGAEDFERRMRAREGDNGLMRFMVLDHGDWLRHFGIETRSRLYTVGNPLVAVTMIEHDLGAALNVPVRLLIREVAGGTVQLGYDLPSSLMSRLNVPEVTAAALKLDAKLETLAARATGAGA